MNRDPLRIVKSPTPPSDAEVVARIAAGDVGAVSALYDAYGASLLAFATRIAGPAEAEDVVQDTFVRATRIASSYDAATPSAKPWLFGIASNVVRERRRSFGRFALALRRFGEQSRPNPANLADVRRDLRIALDGLSTAKRTVVILAEVEGFRCDEIAEMLGVPVGTVYTRLHHARRELRRALGGGS